MSLPYSTKRAVSLEMAEWYARRNVVAEAAYFRRSLFSAHTDNARDNNRVFRAFSRAIEFHEDLVGEVIQLRSLGLGAAADAIVGRAGDAIGAAREAIAREFGKSDLFAWDMPLAIEVAAKIAGAAREGRN